MSQAIDPIQVYHEFAEVPFRPRRVYLKDGQSFDIVSRRHVIVGVDYLDVGIQAHGELPGICESLVSLPLDAIERFEVLPAMQQSA